ncbi:MAG: ATP-grasp domain-containing protein [Candidatus Sulfotelmatobacter sp.]
MRVLVLDGNQNQAVGSVRSLARAGHEVWVGESNSWSKAGWSRSCTRSFEYPATHRHTDEFIAKLVDLASTSGGTLILPMTEATTLPISVHREKLAATGARLVLPDHADLLRAFDKEETTKLAASLGIAVPKTITVASTQQSQELVRSISFPVVLKPRASEELSSSGTVRTAGRPRYASNPQQFHAAYKDLQSRCSTILIQEFVAGEGTGYFALMHHGELRAEFAHQRIRDVYPTGSGSAVRVSIAPDPVIRNASLAMLRALHWHGVAMVEFRKKDGAAPVFMEVNGRFWNSLPLACYAGVDFPALMARMAETGDVPLSTGYSIGVRCRWLLGDFRHLVEVWMGPPQGYPEPYPDRLRTLLAMLTPVPGTYHDMFQWSDPLPELGDWLSFAQRVFKRQAGRHAAAQLSEGKPHA